MKYLFLLMPMSAFAQDAVDFGRMANAIVSFMEAPTLKVLLTLIGILAMCIMMIAKYFYDRNKREDEAYKFSLKVRKEQESNTAKMQTDIAAAIREMSEIVYKQDYEFYLARLQENDTKAIFAKISSQYYDAVSKVVYRTDLSNEDKAALVIDATTKK